MRVSNPVLWHSVELFPESLLEEVITEVCQQKYWDNDERMYSTFPVLKNEALLDKLKHYYYFILAAAMEDLGLKHRSSYDYNLWAQLYSEENSFHPRHDHFSGNEILSWVHFLQVDAIKKKFFFIDSNHGLQSTREFNNSFILFPSWALHKAEALGSSSSNRIVIAGNITLSEISSPGKRVVASRKDNTVSWTEMLTK